MLTARTVFKLNFLVLSVEVRTSRALILSLDGPTDLDSRAVLRRLERKRERERERERLRERERGWEKGEVGRVSSKIN